MSMYKDSNIETKEKILSAAAKIISEKGFMGLSLSQIAKKAGYTEPTIYQYFKGKDDLLFSIAEQLMEKFLSLFNEQIQGISGAYNKLRKLVWVHLRFSDVNKEYMTLVLFECRTNRNFYKSKAYMSMRNHAMVLKFILEEGVKEGIFRSDINLSVVRDIIFGLLDFEAITSLVTHEIPEAVQEHEEIMQLLEQMLLTKYQEELAPMQKRERILHGAIRAFAKKGYADATISEIARLASVAEGTVYEYFKNKEDLLLSIPESRLQDHLDQLDKNFDIHNSERKLRLFIQHHFKLYLSDPDFLIVFLTLIQFNRRFYISRAYSRLNTYVQAFEKITQEIIDAGAMDTKINIRIFRNIFFGAFTHMTLRWFVLGHDHSIDKIREIEDLTGLLTHILIVTTGSTK